jgi:hypothetical protein
MKNVLKWVIIALVLCLMASSSSCSRNGGIIVVRNNYSRGKETSIYSDFEEPIEQGLTFISHCVILRE